MSDSAPLPFGEVLQRLRIAAGLTQEGLAACSGLSPNGIGDLERGAREAPRAATVQLLADGLKLSSEERATLEAAARRGRARAAQRRRGGAVSTSRPMWPMVGREREIAVVASHLAGDGPPVLLVAGELGMGKSRLLAEARQRAEAEGYTVLDGGCHRSLSQEPYAPLLEALARYLHAHRSSPRLRTALRGCSWLTRLLPEQPELADVAMPPSVPWGLSPAEERRLAFAAVARFLANVAGPAGTLLVLDDLHWAGAEAAQLLAAVVRSAEAQRVRVIAAYRSTDVHRDDPLASLVVDLARDRLAARISLEPLGAGASAELLDHLLADVEATGAAQSPALRGVLLSRSGDIPLFLVSYAQAVHAGTLHLDAGAGAVPSDLAEAIEQLVAVHSPPARDVLSVAAVMGSAIPQMLLSRIAVQLGHSKRDSLESLDALCHSRLLVEVDAEGYAFAHDLYREVVAGALSSARRRALHQLVAEVLEATPGEPRIELLAFHYAQGEDEDKALTYLGRAADRALAVYAHADAEDYLRELLYRLERLGRRVEAMRAREQLAGVLTTLSQYAEALALLEDVAEYQRSANALEPLGKTIAQLGWIQALRGAPEEGVARLRALIDSPAGQHLAPESLAALHSALAELFLVAGRHPEQLAAATQAVEFAGAAQHARLIGQTAMCRGSALSMLGRLAEAERVFTEALPVIEAAGDLRDLASTLNDLATIASVSGDAASGARYAERAVAVATHLGDLTLQAYVLSCRGTQHYLAGRWDEAQADFEAATTLLQQIDQSWASPYPLLGLGTLALVRGRFDEALPMLGAAGALAQRIGDRDALRLVQVVLAEHELAQQQPEAAYQRLSALVSNAPEPDHQDMLLLPFVAWAELDRGEAATAEELLARAITRAREAPHNIALADALRVWSLLLIRRHDWQEATKCLAEARSLARAASYPYGEAKVLYLSALLRTSRNEPEDARLDSKAALDLLGPLGEQLYAQRIREMLSALQPSANES